jgi:DNA invertase Pin-like site-specific DNA recombinase
MTIQYADWDEGWKPGTASEFIAHLEQLRADGDERPVVLMCRVSTDDQVNDGNLNDMVREALRDLRQLGIKPLKVFRGQESSSIYCARPILQAAAVYASDHDAILVAPARTRFIRSHRLKLKQEAPGRREYFDLVGLANGVTLATILPPDSPVAFEKSKETKRGQQAKGKTGGGDRNPGYKKRRRERLGLSKTFWLSKVGFSHRQIAGMTGFASGTVYDWKQKLLGRHR